MLAEWDLNDTARAQHLTTQIQHLLNMIYIVICQVYYQNQAEDGTMNARSGRWWHDILARGYRAFIEALLAGGPGHTILSTKEHPQHNFSLQVIQHGIRYQGIPQSVVPFPCVLAPRCA